jgi:hypothetical protein
MDELRRIRLEAIIHQIDSAEVPRVAKRPLTRRESDTLQKLLEARKWKHWFRYMAKVTERRT